MLPSVDRFRIVIQKTFDIASTKAVPRARQRSDNGLLEQGVVEHLVIPFLAEELDGFPLLLYLHKMIWDVVTFLCLHQFEDAALVDPDLICTEFVIFSEIFPGHVCGFTVISVDLFRLGDMVVNKHDEKCIVVAPVPCGIGIDDGVREANVAIDVCLGIQDLKNSTHLAAPVDPVSLLFV